MNVYNGGGVLLTLTSDVIGWWKEYVTGLLSDIRLSSIEEAELGGLRAWFVHNWSGGL